MYTLAVLWSTYFLICSADVLVSSKITASDESASAWFGYSLGNSPNLVVVGAPGDSEFVPSTGAAYLFSRTITGATTTYTQLKKFNASTSAYDYFGYSVATDGNNIVVGVPRRDTVEENGGYAYSFTFNDITEVLSKPGSIAPNSNSNATNSYFGAAVVISNGQYIISSAGGNSPVVSVFSEAGVFQKQYSQITPNSGFGTAIASANNFIFVGAPGNGTYGSVYIYNQTPSVLHINASSTDRFGFSVFANGNFLVVGSPGNLSAHVFAYDSASDAWLPNATLVAQDQVPYSEFGAAVGIDGNFIVVGAPSDGPSSACQYGAVYLYEYQNGTWTQIHKLVAANQGSNTVGHFFGKRVSISGNSILISSYYDSNGNSVNTYQSGSVYYSSAHCPSGTWGADCRPCTCVSGVCDSGLEGAGTCLSCSSDTYGPNCNMTCACENGNCSSGLLGNGTCVSCTSHYYGEDCGSKCLCPLDTCSDGITGNGTCTCNYTLRWGTNCQNQCNCTHGTCDPSTGQCASCNSNFFGPGCEACLCTNGVCDEGVTGGGYCLSCNTGYYTRNCSVPCDCHVNNVVGCSFTGVCLCSPGYILDPSDSTSCIPPPPPKTESIWNLMPTYGWVLVILALIFIAIAMIWIIVVIYLRKKKHESYGTD